MIMEMLEAIHELPEVRLLTIDEVEAALTQLPVHRRDLVHDADNIIRMLRRGLPVKDTSPAWREIQNVIFVSRVDVEIE